MDFDVGPERCAGCNKIVFPPEKLIALKQTWHKWCLKCTTCKATLSTRTVESWDNKPYCRSHMQTAKLGGGAKTMHDATGQGEVVSKDTEVKGVDQSVETNPEKSTITYEKHEGDQSTENAPESSGITYEKHDGDQSTETRPEASTITYETHGGDQSTENAPDASGITYETHGGDQSTENAPDSSSITYESHAADQSTEPAAPPARAPAPAAPVRPAAPAPPTPAAPAAEEEEEYAAGGEEGDAGEETVALYDFEGTEGGEQELTFKEGATIWITDKSDPDNFWYGYDEQNNEGYFPANYTQAGADAGL